MSGTRLVNIKAFFSVAVLVSLFMTGCKSTENPDKNLPDTPNRGKIYVSADESFKPVIDEQVAVYESNHPGTKIIVQYKPEAECLKDMFVDSIRMVIATRRFTTEENNFVNDSLKVGMKSLPVARDGIAVIVNPADTATQLSMNDIRAILTGRIKKTLIPVFDGVKATSTVRFIIDSVLHGDSLTPNAMAARNSQGVIDYVSKNTGVVGFIGVEWIGNPEDTAQQSYLRKVRMVNVESTIVPDTFVKAYQANIYTRLYPMVRDLVYILKENYTGLGTGFANFMSGEIGQLIFKRAYLWPMQKNFGIRPVRLNEESK